MEPIIPKQVIVGEVEAGRPSKVRMLVTNIIKGVNASTFDLAELLYEAKSKNYFTKWGFNTFTDYVKELDIKTGKAYYLVRIVSCMKGAGIPREQYEPVGIQKLREIAKLDPASTFNGNPMSEYIKELVAAGKEKSFEDIQQIVNHLQGLVGDNAFVAMYFSVKMGALKQVIRPVLDDIKMKIGSVGKDDEGNSKDASDGACLEKLALDYMSDPNNEMKTKGTLTMEEVLNGSNGTDTTGQHQSDGQSL